VKFGIKTVVNSDSVTVFKSVGKTVLFSRALYSVFPFLSSTLPGLSASEVTTLWRYITELNKAVINVRLRSWSDAAAASVDSF